MSVNNKFVNSRADFVKDPLDFSIPVAPVASQTNAVFARYSPLFRFQIVGVRLYGTSFTNVTSIDVGLAPTAGGTFVSALNAQITPSNDAEVAAVLAALALTKGSATSQIICRYTTGTGPAAINAFVSVLIRPYPLDGESGS